MTVPSRYALYHCPALIGAGLATTPHSNPECGFRRVHVARDEVQCCGVIGLPNCDGRLATRCRVILRTAHVGGLFSASKRLASHYRIVLLHPINASSILFATIIGILATINHSIVFPTLHESPGCAYPPCTLSRCKNEIFPSSLHSGPSVLLATDSRSTFGPLVNLRLSATHEDTCGHFTAHTSTAFSSCPRLPRTSIRFILHAMAGGSVCV
jgi:hypothetical protein